MEVPKGVRVACVTGVSRGLGAALAAELLARDFDVVGLGRGAAAALGGARFRLVRVDLADPDAVATAARATFGGIAAGAAAYAVLVNNAAVAGPVGPLGTLDARDIAASLATNVVAPLILADEFVRALAGRTRLRIVNVSSGAAARALPGCAAYCVAKAGLEMIAPVAAAERAPGVEAVSVRPGVVDTPMQDFMRSQPARALPVVDVFRAFHAQGALQAPGAAARRIVDRAVLSDVASGTTVSIDAP